MELITLDPGQIKVRDGLDRFRKDMGDLDALVKSFQRTRQIVPIVINRNFELIDGGRRLAACAIAGMQVKAVFEDVIDPYEMRMLELEANLHRKDFTPAEEAAAIKELHELKQSKYGVGGSGAKSDDSWDISKTAKLIGKSRGSVYNALELADLVEKFPQLKQAKKKSEIKKAARGLEKLGQTMLGLAKHKEAIQSSTNLFTVHHGDAIEHMLNMPSGSVHVLLTDPLYGIEADRLMQSCGGRPGSKFNTSGYKIDDSTDKAMLCYRLLARESFRFTVNNPHGYIFCGPEYFWTLRQIFMEEGWQVHVKPLIWIKREVGQANVPRAWPASCYEMLMYIRKEPSCLLLEGRPDWVECPPINPSEKRHPYEKPVPLLVHLLERVVLPGQIVYDPFAGSGSTLEAATRLNAFSIGVDESAEAYANMLERLSTFITKKEDNEISIQEPPLAN
jgi:site-specific DNA-methyltransferase (adenine-specific)